MNEEYAEREQSLLKHFVLRKYLSAASRIIGSWNNLSYVDCCAGPWESRSAAFVDTSFGIAVRVLKESQAWLRDRGKHPRFKALLIEEDQEAYKQLEAYASTANDSSLPVTARNWDFRQHTAEIVQFVSSPPSFSFIFVDPTGWTPAEIAGLNPLLRLKPGEVLINFMSSFIIRFLNDERTNMEEVLGLDYRDIRDLDHEEQEDEAVKRYCELVRRQGDFKYVCALPVMKKDQDAIHFHLIYGTRDPKGVEVFKQVEKQAERETAVVRAELQQSKRANLDLFSPEVLYRREERYKRLSQRSKRNSQAALDSLISARNKISYDDCWAEALQFPAVYQSDLRNWLKDREQAGAIRVEGRSRTSESFQRKSGHFIVKLT